MEKPLYPSQYPEHNPDGSLLRNHQMRILDILCEVDKICRRHNLKYWLCSGTLLGAVRHGGFIPWDDDIDIEMPMGDYKKFLKIAPKELSENFVVQTDETDSGYFYTFAKVRDLNSYLAEDNHFDRIFQYQGVFIDIFPIERTNRLWHWISLRTHGHCYKILKNKRNSDSTCVRQTKCILKIEKAVIYPILRFLSKITPNTPFYAMGVPYALERKDEYVYPLQEISFEGHSFLAPNNTDSYLKAQYGDYMKFPAVIPSASHGFVRID